MTSGKTDGTVDENVFAYSNNSHGERSLIVYNNAYPSTRGALHNSAGYMDKGSGEMRQRSLADSLAVPYDGDLFVAYRDVTSNLEYLRRATDIHHNGITLNLRGFQYIVLLQWRELRTTAEQPWDRLHDMLNGSGVYSLEEALSRLRLRPVHEALRQTFHEGRLQTFADTPQKAAEALLPSSLIFFHRVQAYLLEDGSPLELPIVPQKLPVVDPVPDSFVAPASVVEDDPVSSNGSGAQLSANPSSARAFAPEQAARQPSRLLDLSAMPVDVPVPLDAIPLLHNTVTTAPVREQDTSGMPSQSSAAANGEPAISRVEDESESASPLPPHKMTLEEHYAANLRARLAEVAPDGSPAAGPAARAFTVPGLSALKPAQASAPALAAALISALPANVHADPKAYAALFDRLLLRAGLAESYASLGLEGEGAWRAAALTRIVIAHNIGSVNTEAFWDDADVRWLAGVNESEGKLFFNRELFSQLLPWLEQDAETHALTADEPRLETDLLARAEAAGYQVRLFLHARGFEEASHGFLTPETLLHASPIE